MKIGSKKSQWTSKDSDIITSEFLSQLLDDNLNDSLTNYTTTSNTSSINSSNLQSQLTTTNLNGTVATGYASTAIGSNYTIGNNWSTMPYQTITDYHDIFNNLTSSIVQALTEEELIELVEKMQERLEPNDYKNLIREILMSRHCSEDFIMTYAPNIDDTSVYYKMHKADIVSKAYPRLALMLESKK